MRTNTLILFIITQMLVKYYIYPNNFRYELLIAISSINYVTANSLTKKVLYLFLNVFTLELEFSIAHQWSAAFSHSAGIS